MKILKVEPKCVPKMYNMLYLTLKHFGKGGGVKFTPITPAEPGLHRKRVGWMEEFASVIQFLHPSAAMQALAKKHRRNVFNKLVKYFVENPSILYFLHSTQFEYYFGKIIFKIIYSSLKNELTIKAYR